MKKTKLYQKNILIFLFIYILAVTSSKSGMEEIVPDVAYEDESFGKYSRGNVYIGSKKYILELKNIDEKNDVLIVDLRDDDDPDMKIINSYVIENRQEMKEIIHLICMYEEMYPSMWDRSEEAMYREWIAHNILHSINYKTERTTDVDFNNEDEKVYTKTIFKILN